MAERRPRQMTAFGPPAILMALAGLLALPGPGGETPVEAAAPVHQKRFHRGPDGTLMVPAGIPVRLSMALTAGEAGGPEAPRETEASDARSVVLKEGPNSLQLGDARVHVVADGTPPRTEMSLTGTGRFDQGEERYLSRSVSIRLSASDALSGVAVSLFSKDGAAFEPLGAALPEFTGEGDHRLRFYSVDNVGNVEPLWEYRFHLDGSAPESTLEIIGPHQGDVVAPGSSIALTARDAASGVKTVRYGLDGGGLKVYEGKISLESLAGGRHAIQYRAEDNVGNVETAKTLVLVLDGKPPEVKVSVRGPHHAQGGIRYVTPGSEIEIEAHDDSAGVEWLRYAVEGTEGMSDYRGPFRPPSKGGIHRIRYEASDRVQNVVQGAVNDIYVDLTPPTTEYELSGRFYRREDVTVIDAQTLVTLEAVDLESGVRGLLYKLDGGEAREYSEPLTIASEGDHELSFFATDNVGNQEEPNRLVLRVSPRRATSSPEPPHDQKQWSYREGVGVVGPLAHPFYLRISASPEEGAESYLLVPGDAPSQDRTALTFETSGIRSLGVGIGPRRSKFAVAVDGAAPKTRCVLGGARRYAAGGSIYFGSGLTLALQAADDPKSPSSGLARTLYSIDGSAFTTYRSALDEFTREGAYSCRYHSVDHVGNAESVQETKFIVDTSPPKTRHSLEGPHDGYTLSPQTRIVLKSSDNLSGVARIHYSIDGAKQEVYRGPIAFGALPAGPHVLKYHAVDNLGNDENEKTLSFRLHRDAPRVTFRVVGTHAERDRVLYVSPGSRVVLELAPGVEPASVRYQIDGGAPVPYSAPFSLPAEGRHTLAFDALDAAGNTAVRQTVALFIDRVPPVSRHRIEGPHLERGGGRAIGAATRIVLDAADSGSGVDAILVDVGGRGWKAYSGPFTIRQSGRHRVTYRARDRVGNLESPRAFEVLVDADGPVIRVGYSIPPEKEPGTGIEVLPPGALLFVSAEDASGGLQKITYRIDGGAELIYRAPLSNFRPGSFPSIVVAATDLLGNRSEKTLHLKIKARIE